jgi:predicted short-subunit dehydrogenase-like oxidoreductase (DUF2520 family)
MSRPKLGFIGAGKVGGTLARLASEQGYQVSTIYSRTSNHASFLAQAVAAKVVDSPHKVVEQSDLVLLTVPDGAIQRVVQDLLTSDSKGKGVVHTSGAYSIDVLERVNGSGGMVGSLHPAYPFSGIDTNLEGITFALEASHPLLEDWLSEFVSALNGVALYLPSGTKALYHAALVVASNYTVSLYATAERLLLGVGASPLSASNALNELVGATVRNLQQQGIPDALTGPLVRNDVRTIEDHLTALSTVDTELAMVYRQLARLTYPVLKARGIDIEDIERVLQQDENHRATYNS